MRLANCARILIVSAILAACATGWRPGREPARPTPADTRTVAGIPLLRTAQAEELWQRSSTLFVDVRSPGDYEVGHVPGAVNLPEEEFEQRFPALRPRLARAETIVVYCKSTDCGKSLWSAIRLHQAGLTQTSIYPEGWNEWSDSGHPSARGR